MSLHVFAGINKKQSTLGRVLVACSGKIGWHVRCVDNNARVPRYGTQGRPHNTRPQGNGRRANLDTSANLCIN